MKYVIIGNSTAAVNAIEGIRSVDGEGSITVISDEKYFTYGRPLISYYLCGKAKADNMNYRPLDFYERNGVSTIFGERAVSIDNASKNVVLESGARVDYDKLLLATGSRPFVPPMQNLDGVKEKYTFMKMDDALALEKALSKNKSALIIGAGLIGLKCLEGIFDRVGKVTVVDMADRILPSILDIEGSAIVQKQLEQKGVKFILKNSVSSFEGERSALLTNGEKIDFDILIVAVGVRANVELIKNIGGECDRGICVNDMQETSLKDIYAAGDCATSFDISSGSRRVLALLPNAAMQGKTAGINMAGGDAHFLNAIPMNSIGFFGSHIATAGAYEGEVYEEKSSDSYKKLFYKDNVLKGYILIGCIARAGIYTSLIREQTPLDSIDFSLVKKAPALAAFSKADRAKKLTARV